MAKPSKYIVTVERWECPMYPTGIQSVGFTTNEYDMMISYIKALRLAGTKYKVFEFHFQRGKAVDFTALDL